MTSAEIQRRLAPVADSVPQARHLLDGFAQMVSPEKLEHLRLLVSEVVTNSLRHAGLTEDDQIGVRVMVEDHFIQVEVHDGGPGFEKMPAEEEFLPRNRCEKRGSPKRSRMAQFNDALITICKHSILLWRWLLKTYGYQSKGLVKGARKAGPGVFSVAVMMIRVV